MTKRSAVIGCTAGYRGVSRGDHALHGPIWTSPTSLKASPALSELSISVSREVQRINNCWSGTCVLTVSPFGDRSYAPVRRACRRLRFTRRDQFGTLQCLGMNPPQPDHAATVHPLESRPNGLLLTPFTPPADGCCMAPI